MRAVVLVEGASDRAAITALAERRGRDLDSEGVSVVAMGGSKNIITFLERYAGQGVTLAGLCDANEEGDFRRGLERVGLGTDLTREQMEELGFFVCVRDLEDELIRALGPETVQSVLGQEGELAVFRTFQRQPEWRDRPVGDQLHRFVGTKSGRKARAAAALVDALDLDRVPRPLDGVLGRV